jgi:hypothetical protein
MADLSTLSDAELMALYKQQQQPVQAQPQDLSKLSDAELIAVYNQQKASNAPIEQAGMLEKPIGNIEPQPSQAAQIAGGAVRGAGPIATGAAIGAALGAPAAGVGAIPGAFAGAAAMGITQSELAGAAVDKINKTFGTNYSRPDEAMQHFLTYLGVPQADTEAARLVQSTSKGMAEAASGVGIGKALSTAFPALSAPGIIGEAISTQPAAQMAMGGGAALGTQAAKEAGLGPVAQFGAGLVGGMAGGMGMGLGTPAFQAEAQKETVPLTEIAIKAARGNKAAMEEFAKRAIADPKMQKAASDLGLELSPELLANDPQYIKLVQAVASSQNSRLGIQQQEQLYAVGQRANKLLEELGGSSNFAGLSEKVKATMQGAHTELKASEDSLWNKLRETIPAKTPAPGTSTMAEINKAASEFGGADKLGKMEQAIRNDLQPKRMYDAAGNFTGMKMPTYALLERRRQEVGDATRGMGPFSDAGIGLAKKYYALLSEDAGRVAEAVGAGELSKQAKAFTVQRKQLEDRLTTLFGDQLDKSLSGKLQTATNVLAEGDVDQLVKILNAAPKELRQEIVATGLSEAFGKATHAKGELNFDKFAQWWHGIEENKQAKTLIMSNLPAESRQNLQSLADLSSQVSKVLAAKVNTGKILDAMKTVERPMEKVVQAAKNVAMGVAIGTPAEAAASAIGLGGHGVGYAVTTAVTGALMAKKSAPLQAADELLMSPKFQNLIREMAAKYPAGAPKVEAEVLKSSAFRKFADAANIPQAARATFFSSTVEPKQESK